MARWKIDPDHTVAAFSARHLMVATVRGQFNTISGTIDYDPSDMAASRVEAAIEIAGLHTGIKKRDEHLRSPDFFDAANHPQLLFRSTAVEPTGLHRCDLHGDLTMRGVTQPVVLDWKFIGPAKSPYGATFIGFKATARIQREKWGISWNDYFEGGGMVAGKWIKIRIDGEADLVEEDK